MFYSYTFFIWHSLSLYLLNRNIQIYHALKRKIRWRKSVDECIESVVKKRNSTKTRNKNYTLIQENTLSIINSRTHHSAV